MSRKMGMWSVLVAVAAFAVAGCSGAEGPAGQDGTGCTAVTNADATVTITCGDGTSVTLKNGDAGAQGEDGEPCTATSDTTAGTVTITCPGATPVVLKDGVAGTDGESCTATADDVAGTVTITCPGATPVVVSNGADAEPCTVARDDVAKTTTITCPGATPVVIADGANGEDGEPCTATRDDVAKTTTITCPGADPVVIADGTNGLNGVDGQPCAVVRDDVAGTTTITCPGSSPVVVYDGQDVDPAALDQLEALAAVGAESCAVCHSETGAEHQAAYDQYNDASDLGLTIDSVVSVDSVTAGKFDITLTFSITKGGQAFLDEDGLPKLNQKRFMGIRFVDGKFVEPISFGTIKKTATDGTFTAIAKAQAYALELADAAIYGYVADEILDTEGMTLYSNVASAALTFNAFSTATADTVAGSVAGCEKCHGTPYLKHGYRAAQVEGLADFVACKFCHYDTRNGGHQAWQVLVDDPLRHSQLGTTPLTTEEKAKYAYIATAMNDTHMSHAMEFPYPQSMANCATCHEGKLDKVLADKNFTPATCKSCHPVNGSVEYGTADRALNTIMPEGHDLVTMSECNMCHKVGGMAPDFKEIHSGFDKQIYAVDGVKYSQWFKGSIDTATFADNVLTFTFSVTEDAASTSPLEVANVIPTVMVGLYGWDSKDYLVGPHASAADKKRNLEAVLDGTDHPRVKRVSVENGVWTVTADLTLWADKIANGSVKRAEIAFMPKLLDGTTVVALDAPSRTFDLTTNAFDDGFYGTIAKVEGCNNCHDALATTFHSADRGGSIVVCRMCHITLSGGSHLEMQSRSIDSYVHAIHSFQNFDSGDVDMTDPVEKERFEMHKEHVYPNFTIKNCKSCHEDGAFDVPDQSKSMPGLLSAADAWATDRNIGAVPAYITGPGSRACGSCHRAHLINEDEAGHLAALNQHTKSNGYLIENVTGLLDLVVAKVMSLF